MQWKKYVFVFVTLMQKSFLSFESQAHNSQLMQADIGLVSGRSEVSQAGRVGHWYTLTEQQGWVSD